MSEAKLERFDLVQWGGVDGDKLVGIVKGFIEKPRSVEVTIIGYRDVVDAHRHGRTQCVSYLVLRKLIAVPVQEPNTCTVCGAELVGEELMYGDACFKCLPEPTEQQTEE